MGCNQCLPMVEPVWFTYYGPIRPELSGILNAAVSDSFNDGVISPITIQTVRAPKIRVPAALNTPPIIEHTDESITFSFATTDPGTVTLQAGDSNESHLFGVGLTLQQEFKRPPHEEWTLTFEFPLQSGVTARMYKIQNKPVPIVEDDKIVMDGVVSTISKIYKEEVDNSDNDSEDGVCLICYAEKATVVAFPCRHCCMCRSCSERFASMTVHCPVCRACVSELIECITDD